MPTSKTKELAKKLGLLKQKRKADYEAGGSRKKRRKGQILSYVIVIDFESTCWKEKKGAQEIIEFPAVLLDLQTGDIVSEFQQYVQPQECPILSDFCKELTGISQVQVDGGVPLPTCIYLFEKWVRVLRGEKGVCLMEPGQQYCSSDTNLCALATWSDWDLGVCLQYECRRKQIRKPLYFDQWIDLRIVYKQFYDRKPSGLCGSLEDLGIQFTGREHCGLDDARNTAKLCYRLVTDGCKLNITKCLAKKKSGPVIRAPETSTRSGRVSERPTAQQKPTQHENQPPRNKPSSISHPPTTVEETPPLVEREDSCENATMRPQTTAVDQCKTPTEQEKKCLSDESFLNGISAHEFEELEKDNFSEFATASETCSKTEATQTFSVLSKPATGGETTPSRTTFLSHIAPVTLLPAKANQHTQCVDHQHFVSACTSLPGLSHTPSLLNPPQVHQTPASHHTGSKHTREPPATHHTGSREPPATHHTGSREPPATHHTGSREPPATHHTGSREPPATPHTGSREPPATHYTGSREPPATPHTGSREPPATHYTGSREPPATHHTGSREPPATHHTGSKHTREPPATHYTGSREPPATHHTGSREPPATHHTGSREPPATPHTGSREPPATHHTGSKHTREPPATPHTGSKHTREPPATPHTGSEHTREPPATDKTTVNSSRNHAEGATIFQTPSTVQWMRAKSFQSSTCSSGSPQPFNGGKLTPPLCGCGKRARRRLVTSPGPNQGRPFFSCPAGRDSGCQYFRWETLIPHTSLHTDTAVDLSSEYS